MILADMQCTANMTNLKFTNMCAIVVSSSFSLTIIHYHYLLMENQRSFQSANFDLVNTYFGNVVKKIAKKILQFV